MRLLVSIALLSVGCSGPSTSSPVTPAPFAAAVVARELGTFESLAYRRTLDIQVQPSAPGRDAPPAQHLEGWVFLEKDASGEWVVREGEPSDAEPGEFAQGADLREYPSYSFPLPDRPLGREPQVVNWVGHRIGSTYFSRTPDLAFEDRFTLVATSEESLEIELERSMVGEGLSTEQTRGRLVYDRAAQRYTRLETSAEYRSSLDTGLTGGGLNVHSITTSVLEFDPQASAERSRFLRRMAQARASARADYDTYLREHSIEQELTAVMTAEQFLSSVMQFYLLSHPAEFWQEGLSGRLIPREEFLEYMRPVMGASWAAPSMPALEPYLADADVQSMVLEISNPAARQLHRVLAGWGSQAAQRALAQAEISLESLRAASPDTLWDEGVMTLFRLQDPVQIVEFTGIILRAMAATDDPERRIHFSQWLEGITFVSLGPEPGPWQAYWESHRAMPYEEWVLEGARSDVPLLRYSALNWLAFHPASVDAVEAAAESLEHAHTKVRLEAAAVLLTFDDRRGVSELVGALDGPPEGRRRAFAALARAGSHRLGYDPEAPEMERAIAAARWQEWFSRDQ